MYRFIAIGVDIAIIALISISMVRNEPLFNRGAPPHLATAPVPAREALAR